jgi:hypothetical protein
MFKRNNENFLIEDFFHLPPVSLTPVVHLEVRISMRIYEKFETAPNGIIRGSILSDLNFPPAIPCANGECLKIIRLENGFLSELVTAFLELTRGKGIPMGSVVLISSVTHLQRRGVGGYATDLANEIGRLSAILRGGAICLPGVPILVGGCEDRTVPRAIFEFGTWLDTLGGNALTETWEAVKEGLLTRAKGDMFICETFMHNMPASLLDTANVSSLEIGGGLLLAGPTLSLLKLRKRLSEQ